MTLGEGLTSVNATRKEPLMADNKESLEEVIDARIRTAMSTDMTKEQVDDLKYQVNELRQLAQEGK